MVDALIYYERMNIRLKFQSLVKLRLIFVHFVVTFSYKMNNMHYKVAIYISVILLSGIQITGIETLLTRRILSGHETDDTRPYMVYLRPAQSSDPLLSFTNWLCGGVIIHESYILTSAACIENVKNFYVVSGTHRWTSGSIKDDECINNGAKKAVWKCVPKDYVYDGDQFDNIRWMSNDIAVVKVEDNFDFERRIQGCDFIPKMIAFNNRSEDLEKPGTTAYISGWGSTEKFVDRAGRAGSNSPELLESTVVLISNKNCKKQWPQEYHTIIDNNMICSKDNSGSAAMSALCSENGVNCTDLAYSDEDDDKESKRRIFETESLTTEPRMEAADLRRAKAKTASGGFCENDHGGPLIVGQGATSVVIGLITASLTKTSSQKCSGPFLFTSVWKNRNLVNCAISKEIGFVVLAWFSL